MFLSCKYICFYSSVYRVIEARLSILSGCKIRNYREVIAKELILSFPKISKKGKCLLLDITMTYMSMYIIQLERHNVISETEKKSFLSKLNKVGMSLGALSRIFENICKIDNLPLQEGYNKWNKTPFNPPEKLDIKDSDYKRFIFRFNAVRKLYEEFDDIHKNNNKSLHPYYSPHQTTAEITEAFSHLTSFIWITTFFPYDKSEQRNSQFERCLRHLERVIFDMQKCMIATKKKWYVKNLAKNLIQELLVARNCEVQLDEITFEEQATLYKNVLDGLDLLKSDK